MEEFDPVERRVFRPDRGVGLEDDVAVLVVPDVLERRRRFTGPASSMTTSKEKGRGALPTVWAKAANGQARPEIAAVEPFRNPRLDTRMEGGSNCPTRKCDKFTRRTNAFDAGQQCVDGYVPEPIIIFWARKSASFRGRLASETARQMVRQRYPFKPSGDRKPAAIRAAREKIARGGTSVSRAR
jgi:hypothetical protein